MGAGRYEAGRPTFCVAPLGTVTVKTSSASRTDLSRQIKVVSTNGAPSLYHWSSMYNPAPAWVPLTAQKGCNN